MGGPEVALPADLSSQSRALESSSAGAGQLHYSTPKPLLLTHASEVSIFLDDKIFEADLEADPFELPPFDVAEKLLQAYLQNVHNSYPLLNKKAFTHQFYHCTYGKTLNGRGKQSRHLR